MLLKNTTWVDRALKYIRENDVLYDLGARKIQTLERLFELDLIVFSRPFPHYDKRGTGLLHMTRRVKVK